VGQRGEGRADHDLDGAGWLRLKQASRKVEVSATPLCIFQFPTTIGRRAASRLQRRNRGQDLAGKELQRGAAAGRDVADGVGDPGTVDGHHRLAAATTVKAFDVASARATAIVPAANCSVSKTPIGPFQNAVLAPAIAAA